MIPHLYQCLTTTWLLRGLFFAFLAAGVSSLNSYVNASDIALPAGVDPTTGFRMERYRAPVPDVLPGGSVLDTGAVQQQLNSGTIFIDVWPPLGLGADPISGVWLLTEPHDSIEGAVWLPEVGRGHIEAEHIEYFSRNLSALTNANLDIPLLFFCTADCWQSWNAAKRAILWGHTKVFWYPEGTDGWQEQGLDLVRVAPVNFLGE